MWRIMEGMWMIMGRMWGMGMAIGLERDMKIGLWKGSGKGMELVLGRGEEMGCGVGMILVGVKGVGVLWGRGRARVGGWVVERAVGREYVYVWGIWDGIEGHSGRDWDGEMYRMG